MVQVFPLQLWVCNIYCLKLPRIVVNISKEVKYKSYVISELFGISESLLRLGKQEIIQYWCTPRGFLTPMIALAKIQNFLPHPNKLNGGEGL